MSNRDFSAAFTVDETPEEVFAAVNDVRGWWSRGLVGKSDKLGAEFKYRYKDMHRSTQKVTELVPGKKVVWKVLDSKLTFVEDGSEWEGTDVIFDITKKGAKTELRMTHKGLVPDLECFDACSGGWAFYFNESLRELITTGKGQPDPKLN